MIGSQLRLRPREKSIFRAVAFSQLYFWVGMHRGRVLPRKFEKFHNWAKPSPRSNPVIMNRTITGILRKIREIEASSVGAETLRGCTQFKPDPLLQPKNQGSQTSVNFRRTRRCVFLSPRRQILNLVLNLVCRSRGLSFDY